MALMRQVAALKRHKWQATEGNSQLYAVDLSPATKKELSPANNHVSEFASKFFLK